MSEVLLDVKDLCITFGKQNVVKNANLKVYKGKTTAIVGESGSGKSVTALAVLGLLPPHAKVTTCKKKRMTSSICQ